MSFERDLVELRPRLLSLARKLARDNETARDLVQDTLLRALERKETFAPGSNLKGWTATIMYNLWINSVRHRTRFQHVSLASPEAESLYAPVIGPSQEYAHALKQVLLRIREYVKPGMIHPVLLAALGWEQHEISARVGIPQGSVKSRVSRGRSAIREAWSWL